MKDAPILIDAHAASALRASIEAKYPGLDFGLIIIALPLERKPDSDMAMVGAPTVLSEIAHEGVVTILEHMADTPCDQVDIERPN
jgi:hypothetical protein